MEGFPHLCLNFPYIDVPENRKDRVVGHNELLVKGFDIFSAQGPDGRLRPHRILPIGMVSVVTLPKKTLDLVLPTFIDAPNGQKGVFPLFLDLFRGKRRAGHHICQNLQSRVKVLLQDTHTRKKGVVSRPGPDAAPDFFHGLGNLGF